MEACGICHTDLKKIEHNLLHAAARLWPRDGRRRGRGGRGCHEIPARRSRGRVSSHSLPATVSIAARKLYAQCPVYKKVGITAGFEPAGGGFAQYVRVMDWIVERGVEKIPDGVSFERATLVEPLNTCLKAVVQCDPQPGRFRGGHGAGPDRPDVHHAGEAHRRARCRHRHHCRTRAGIVGALRRRIRLGSPRDGRRGRSQAADRTAAARIW